MKMLTSKQRFINFCWKGQSQTSINVFCISRWRRGQENYQWIGLRYDYRFSRGNETIIPTILYGQGMRWKGMGAETELHLDTHGILQLACVKQYSLGCCERGAQSQIWVGKR